MGATDKDRCGLHFTDQHCRVMVGVSSSSLPSAEDLMAHNLQSRRAWGSTLADTEKRQGLNNPSVTFITGVGFPYSLK